MHGERGRQYVSPINRDVHSFPLTGAICMHGHWDHQPPGRWIFVEDTSLRLDEPDASEFDSEHSKRSEYSGEHAKLSDDVLLAQTARLVFLTHFIVLSHPTPGFLHSMHLNGFRLPCLCNTVTTVGKR